MTPLKALKAAVSEFERREVRYCLIGGHAASLYRGNERVTKDVDFAIVANPEENSRKVAIQVIESIGLKAVLGFIPGLSNRPKSKTRGKITLVTSSPPEGSLTGIIDILLPELPWIPDAVDRAQSNRIDLGFARVPVITPEDLIVAKCFALSNAPDRFQDLDDIKEISHGLAELDIDYIRVQLELHSVPFPKQLRTSVSREFQRLYRLLGRD